MRIKGERNVRAISKERKNPGNKREVGTRGVKGKYPPRTSERRDIEANGSMSRQEAKSGKDEEE